jgi:hypothetical protein
MEMGESSVQNWLADAVMVVPFNPSPGDCFAGAGAPQAARQPAKIAIAELTRGVFICRSLEYFPMRHATDFGRWRCPYYRKGR